MGAWAVVTAALRDLARLVVPVECPGCGRPDEVLCGPCAAELAAPVRRCEGQVPRLDRLDGVPPLPVWTAADYGGPLRGIVVAWKDRGRADLTGVLVATARRAGREVGERLGGPDRARLADLAGPVLVVPVPTTARARRRRGADLVARLAGGVAEGLREAGVPAQVRPALRRRAAADQVGLGARARGRNAAVGITIAADPRGRWHLLVDDVVTTGATLAACCRVLERAGGPVLGAVVLAATPPPGAGRRKIEPIRADTPREVVRSARAVPG